MQEVFAIPVVDEVKNSDNDSEENKEDIINEENTLNNIENDGFIDDEIQNMDVEDLDKLFLTEKIA